MDRRRHVRLGQGSGTHTTAAAPATAFSKRDSRVRAGAGGGLDKTGLADSVFFLPARLQRRHEPAEVPAHQRVRLDGAVAGHGVHQLPRHHRHLPSAPSRSCTLPRTSSAYICSCTMDGTFSFCTQQGCTRAGIVSW